MSQTINAANPNVTEDIAAVRAQTDIKLALDAYTDRIPAYGFTHVIMGHIVNPVMYPASFMGTILSNWDPAWLAEWISNRYLFHDAVGLKAHITDDPFTWESALTGSGVMARKIHETAKSFGLVYGLAIPVKRAAKPRGCVSLACKNKTDFPKDWDDIAAFSRATFLHLDSLAPYLPFDDQPKLTDREIEILYNVAAGKTNWEVGVMMDISAHSVRDHLKSISAKLETANRAHSVARAIQLGLILP